MRQAHGQGALGVVDSAIEAPAAQDADFDLDHVQPAGVLEGVMELQATQNAPGFGGRKGFRHSTRCHRYRWSFTVPHGGV
jgi:hypothetical protein